MRKTTKPPRRSTATPVPPVEVYCFAAAQVPAGATEPPNRLLVCPWGATATRKGPVILDATAAEFAAGQKARRWDRVALDFQHNTVCPSKPGTAEHAAWLAQEPRAVAAYGTPELVPGEGLFLTNLRWTPEGRERFTSYEDISPGVVRNAQGRVVALHSAALCRAGEIDGLTLFAAGMPDWAAMGKPVPEFRGIYLTPTKEIMIDITKKLLKKAGITVPEDASEETILGLATTYLGTEDEGEGEDGALSAEIASLKETVTSLSAAVETLKASTKAAQETNAAQRRAALKAEATAAGKVIPLSDAEIDQMPIELFAALVEKLPADKVPTSHQSAGKAAGGAVETFSAEEQAAMGQMGISPEKWTEHRRKQDAAKAGA